MTHKFNGKHDWQIGQQVQILNGPFKDLTGPIDRIDNQRKRVRVIVNVFFRDTPVEFTFDQIIPVKQ